jgi:hypothetical protein
MKKVIGILLSAAFIVAVVAVVFRTRLKAIVTGS